MDPATLFISNALIAVLSGGLLLIARGCGRATDALGWWAISLGAIALGLAMRVLPLPTWVTLDLSRAAMLTGTGLTVTAALVFGGRPARPWIGLVGAVLWLVTCRIPEFQASERAQLMLTSAIAAAYSAAVAWVLARAPEATMRAGRAAVLVSIVHGLVHVFLGLVALSSPTVTPGLNALILLEAQIHIIGFTFLLMAMAMARAEAVKERSLTEARAAGESRRQFVAQMSHEVRTPLNGIIGVTELLRHDPRLTDDQRQNVDVLDSAGRHLLAIVNDALDLAKIDAGRLDIAAEPLCPGPAAEACLALIRPAARDKQIAVRLSIDAGVPEMVIGDATRLQQILLNLVWNALKFTPERGAVTLRIGFDRMLTFDVIDTGPGIPPEKRARLFQDFAQFNQTGSGTGLGLALSSRLAVRMGGQLSYDQGPAGTGSRFQLRLPWPATTGGETAVRSIVRRPARKLHVLIVCDDTAHRRQLRAFLLYEGHRVTDVPGVADALNQLPREDHDALLIDARSPDIDGAEIARQVRDQGGEHGAIPIIGICVNATPSRVDACHEAGMTLVLTQSVERASVIHALAQVTAEPSLRSAVSAA